MCGARTARFIAAGDFAEPAAARAFALTAAVLRDRPCSVFFAAGRDATLVARAAAPRAADLAVVPCTCFPAALLPDFFLTADFAATTELARRVFAAGLARGVPALATREESAAAGARVRFLTGVLSRTGFAPHSSSNP